MHLPYVGFPSWRGLSSQSTVKPLTWVRPWKEFKAKPYSDSCNKTWSSGVLEYSAMHATGHIPEAQCAFKILMIHEVLQFALRIAFRCVLHRCGSLDIRCWKLYTFIFLEASGRRHRSVPSTLHFFWIQVIVYMFGIGVRTILPSHFHASIVPSLLCGCYVILVVDIQARQVTMDPRKTRTYYYFTGEEILDRCGNDPSAGSPTETLLRLHLPLNDKV